MFVYVVSSEWGKYEMSMDNEDFAEYVERYAKARDISIAVALTHEIVKEYGRYLKWANT